METIANTQQNCTNFQHSRALDADRHSDPTIAPGRASLPDLTTGDVSDSTEALNFLLAALDCPRSVRSLIDALTGFSAGRDRFEFFHFDLGYRTEQPAWSDDPEERKRDRMRIERNVGNWLDATLEWAEKWNLPIQYTPGKRTTEGEAVPSSIVFPVVRWGAEVATLARQAHRYPVLTSKERTELFKRSVKRILRNHKVAAKPTDKTRTKRTQPASQLLAALKTNSQRYVAQFSTENEIDPKIASAYLINQLASSLLADEWGMDVKTYPHPEPENADAPANVCPEPSNLIGANFCKSPEEESHGGGAGSIERLPAVDWEANQPEPKRPADAGTIPACDSLDCAEGEITEAEQLDELDGDAMTLLQAVLSVGGEVDQAFFKNDKEARGAGKGIDDEAKEPTTKITTERFSELLAGAIAKAGLMIRSFIARIRGPLLQIDDCDEHTVLRFEPFALFVAETSPQNFQVWLAFKDEEDKEAAAKRLFTGKNGALAGGLKGNRGSSGAIRWAGSRNFKRDDAPLVRLDSVQMGRITTPAELDDAGLLDAPVAPVAVVALDAEPVRASSSSWPDYNVALVKAERKPDSVEPDESNADSKWVTSCLTQYRKRRTDVIAMLRQVSPHAREKEPESYAALTVDNVANYLQQKNGRAYA